jgi:predicted aspartyl protease
MNRLFLASSIVCVLVAGVISVPAANAQQRQAAVLIAGDKPVTEDQVRAQLQTDGWSDVQISRDGQHFQVTASKNGQADKMIVDAQTGRVLDQADNDHDDDD